MSREIPRKLYIIAGEASGDLHGSNLIKALKSQDANLKIRSWGGDLMQAAGAEVVKHYKELAFMGFVEVVKNLPTIIGNLSFCKKDILEFQPDVMVLIDYPGFNLRIAKWAKKQGIKVIYYISPQIWAWNSKRVHAIKRDMDRMITILPFEKDFYKKYGMVVDYVGHPLLDVVNNFKSDKATFHQKWNLSEKPIIALLPGSRKQEIRTTLGIMLKMVAQFTDYQFVVAGAPSQDSSFYQTIFEQVGLEIPLVENETYDLLSHSTAALVTSGTATLETALFEVPQVVCYKGNPISFQIAKRLVNVEYISLVNLIADRTVVTELIQDEFNTENLKHELTGIILDPSGMKQDYQEVKKMLGNSGASFKTAQLILENMADQS